MFSFQIIKCKKKKKEKKKKKNESVIKKSVRKGEVKDNTNVIH